MATPEELALKTLESIGYLGNWLQAIGAVVIIWIAIQIINWFINRKRLKVLDEFKSDISRIEQKLNKIEKKLK